MTLVLPIRAVLVAVRIVFNYEDVFRFIWHSKASKSAVNCFSFPEPRSELESVIVVATFLYEKSEYD
jgi:predicted metal-dependent TIM-barrel fold hydrolase